MLVIKWDPLKLVHLRNASSSCKNQTMAACSGAMFTCMATWKQWPLIESPAIASFRTSSCFPAAAEGGKSGIKIWWICKRYGEISLPPKLWSLKSHFWEINEEIRGEVEEERFRQKNDDESSTQYVYLGTKVPFQGEYLKKPDLQRP